MRKSWTPLLRTLLLAVSLAAADMAGGAAAETVTARIGDHGAFGRLVLEFDQAPQFHVEKEGSRLVLHVSPEVPVGVPATPPKGAQAIAGGIGQAALTLDPGTTYKVYRLGSRLVIDLYPQGGTSPPSRDTPPAASKAASRAKAPAKDAPAREERAEAKAAAKADPAAKAAATPLYHPRLARHLPKAQPLRAAAAPAPLAATPAPAPLAAATPGVALTAIDAADRSFAEEAIAEAGFQSNSSPPARPEAESASRAEAAASAAAPESAGSPASPPPPSTSPERAAAGETAPASPAAPGAPAPPRPDAPANPPAVAAAAPPPAALIAAPDAPLALLASRVPPPPELGGVALLLPFPPATGAAAVRRGSEALVVFDEKRPIDLRGLANDPFFGHAVIQDLPNGTLLRLPLAPEAALAFRTTPRGWVVIETIRPPPLDPIPAEAHTFPDAGLGLLLAARTPSHVIALTDPLSGLPLLFGTVRAPGQGIALSRQTPEFDLLPTWLGVAVEAYSERPVLSPSAEGFTLMSGVPGEGLALSAFSPDTAPLARAAAFTRRFDFPSLPATALYRRLEDEILAASRLPARERTPLRRQVASTLISLGFGPEAQAVLSLARDQDPAASADPDLAGLDAIAALVAGRSDEAAAIDAPSLAGSDEVALWRAVRGALQHEGDPAAAAGFAASWPLILAYPEGLRHRLLPLAAETMALGGQVPAAQKLVANLPEEADLDLARALIAEKTGNVDAALALYDRLAQSRDRLLRARAAVRAVELRLAAKRISPEDAVSRLDALLYAWRGDEREEHLRLELAALEEQTGAWRKALALLRETEAIFPRDRALIHARLEQTFADLIDGDKARNVPPFELVTLVDENADLLPGGAAGEALVARFADSLIALDLPERAVPVLRRLIDHAASPAAKAELGAKLAALELDLRDPAAASAALTATAPAADAEISPTLAEERAILAARAAAAQGDLLTAMADLAPFDDTKAQGVKAELFENAHDWPQAEKALRAYVAGLTGGDETLGEHEARLVLRLATAAAQANDEALLGELAQKFTRRFPPGPLADMLRVLTSRPATSPSDISEVSKDVAAARSIPEALEALKAAGTKPKETN